MEKEAAGQLGGHMASLQASGKHPAFPDPTSARQSRPKVNSTTTRLSPGDVDTINKRLSGWGVESRASRPRSPHPNRRIRRAGPLSASRARKGREGRKERSDRIQPINYSFTLPAGKATGCRKNKAERTRLLLIFQLPESRGGRRGKGTRKGRNCTSNAPTGIDHNSHTLLFPFLQLRDDIIKQRSLNISILITRTPKKPCSFHASSVIVSSGTSIDDIGVRGATAEKYPRT